MDMEERQDRHLADLLAEIDQKRRAKSTGSEPNGSTGPTSGTPEDGQSTRQLADLAYHSIYKRYSRTSFMGIKLRGLPDNANIRENFERVQTYADHLDAHMKLGEGLILSGPCGTLKTQMATAVLRYQLDKGGGGYMVPMATLIDNLYTMREQNREEAARYEKRLRTTPLLVIDDLGAENNRQDWIRSKIDSIISERYDKMLSTVITTNYTAQELGDTYGGRILDRVRSNAFYLEFKGDSERQSLDLDKL